MCSVYFARLYIFQSTVTEWEATDVHQACHWAVRVFRVLTLCVFKTRSLQYYLNRFHHFRFYLKRFVNMDWYQMFLCFFLLLCGAQNYCFRFFLNFFHCYGFIECLLLITTVFKVVYSQCGCWQFVMDKKIFWFLRCHYLNDNQNVHR